MSSSSRPARRRSGPRNSPGAPGAVDSSHTAPGGPPVAVDSNGAAPAAEAQPTATAPAPAPQPYVPAKPNIIRGINLQIGGQERPIKLDLWAMDEIEQRTGVVLWKGGAMAELQG